MNDARTSAGVHTRDVACRRLAVTLLAISVFCGALSVDAQAAPIQIRQPPAYVSKTDTGRTDVQAKPALKHAPRKGAVDSQPCPATPKQQHTDTRASGMALLLGILLTPRHGT